MPRRKASTTAKNPTITPPSKSHKRHLSSSATPVTATASRQSKRIKASAENTPTTNGKKATPKKSKYFEGPNSDDEDHDQDEQDASTEVAEEETSGYEDEDASATLPSSPSASEEEDVSESDDPRTWRAHKKKKKQQAHKSQAGKLSTTNVQSTVSEVIEKGKELWRQGVKVGLGPGKEVFIEKPKPRGDGGIKYVPDRIHPNTMAFLADLRDNNEREWMKSEWRFLCVDVCYDPCCGLPTVHYRVQD